jgi:hypothetical protein
MSPELLALFASRDNGDEAVLGDMVYCCSSISYGTVRVCGNEQNTRAIARRRLVLARVRASEGEGLIMPVGGSSIPAVGHGVSILTKIFSLRNTFSASEWICLFTR